MYDFQGVVPENIHTPPRRGLEIQEGWGWGVSETQEIPERRRVERSI